MSKRRVVITGLGTINPLGNNVTSTWQKLTNGISGIDHITQFDTSSLPVTFAGEVKDFDANDYMGKQHARKLDRSAHLSIYATEQALQDSGFDTKERLGPNVGIVFGTGIGGIGATEDAVRVYDSRGPSRINPLAITQLMPNSSTGQVAIKFGIEGPSLTITTACAASANAIGEAKKLIENGVVDVVITGGTESGTTPMTIAAFAQIRALSSKNDTPSEACRPFDMNRDGFLDLVTVGADSNGLLFTQVYLNSPNYILKKSLLLFKGDLGVTAGSFDFGDYNNDGYIDFAITGKNSQNDLITYIIRNYGSCISIAGRRCSGKFTNATCSGTNIWSVGQFWYSIKHDDISFNMYPCRSGDRLLSAFSLASS